MTLYPKLILDALATVRYPGNKKNLVEAEMVADNLRIDGMKVSFSLIFEKPTDPFMKSMVKAAETAIHTYVSPEVEVTIATESRQAARPEVGAPVRTGSACSWPWELPFLSAVRAWSTWLWLRTCFPSSVSRCPSSVTAGHPLF